MRTGGSIVRGLALGAALLWTAGTVYAQTVNVDVGSASTSTSGGTVMIPVTLATNGQTVVGTQNDILFDPAFVSAAAASACMINPAIGDRADGCDEDPIPSNVPCKTLNRSLGDCPGADGCPKICDGGGNDGNSCSVAGDCPGGACVADPAFAGYKRFRGIIVALGNTNAIPDTTLYTCTFTVPAGDEGTTTLVNRNIVVSGTSGRLPSAGDDGQVSRVGNTPTPTATNTLPVPTATLTSTATNTATVTATRTNTPTATVTNTRGAGGDEDDGCQIVSVQDSRTGWLLLVPAAALLWLRRRAR
jgi:hypothetical protein